MLWTRNLANEFYAKMIKLGQKIDTLDKVLKQLAKTDLFFLLTRICNRKDIDRDWLFDRCIEVESEPNGYLDLWSREHYKSTIITFGLTIQNILNDPEITVGIFSYKVGAAVEFVKQIKREFEDNKLLQRLFPEILYDNPKHQASRWNEDGIIVKRKTNPKEATVEAHGLVESQPTGKHFKLCVYDDVVTEKSVATPEQIKKTTDAFQLSLNLGAEGGVRRIIGTRYHYDDTYATIMENKTAIPRIYPATDNGKVDGKPVLWSQEYYDEKRKSMSPYIFSCQMLQSPRADSAIGFHLEWIQFWPRINFKRLNRYILVDPANTKNKRSDYTAMIVFGYGEDECFYVIDIVRDRLDLREKAQMLMHLHREYKPITAVGYEQYGMQADIQAIKEYQSQENYHFKIKPLGGNIKKEDRIQRLIPIFEQGRILMPDRLIRSNRDGEQIDLVKSFVDEEYLAWPYARHDDMLDCFSRICDDDFPIRAPSMTRRLKTTKAKTEYNPFAR